MAIGDTVSNFASTANNATLDIQPGSGIEWMIQVLTAEEGREVEISLVDDAAGTNKKLAGRYQGITGTWTFRLTNTRWMQLKNVCGVTIFLGYQGVVTK